MNPVRNDGKYITQLLIFNKNHMKISNGMKIKKIIFFTILLSVILLPFLSFAQFGQVGSESQIMPNNGGGDTVGSQSQIMPNNGGGDTIGSEAQRPLNTGSNTSGATLGTEAQFTTSGLLCKLAPKPTLRVLLNYVSCILLGYIIPLIFGLAIVLFIWGVIQYVINTGDEAKKQKGKMFMIWGIIALTVMTSVWGLVSILGKTFGSNAELIVPQLNTGNNVPSNYQAPLPPPTQPITTPDQNSSTNTTNNNTGSVPNSAFGGLQQGFGGGGFGN